MAILKFISRTYPVSGNCFGSVKRTINYITNPVKTEQGRYVSSLNCPFHPSQAFQKMKHTTIHYGKASDNPNNRLGYHWTISWSPEEKVTEEQAFEVAEKFCAAVLPEQEVIFSVHNDKGHMHAHIYFNSVNLYSGKKFHYSSGDWKTVFQPALDQINQECGLQTLEESTGIPLESYSKKRKKTKQIRESDKKKRKQQSHNRKSGNNKYYKESSEETKVWMDLIRRDLDEAILYTDNYEAFLQYLRQEKKYYIGREGKSETWGDYFSLRKAGMGRSRRNYTLGAAYTVEMIKKRLAAYQKPLRNFTMENEIFLLYSIPFVKRERVAAYNEYQLHFYREMLKYGTRSRSQPVDHKLIRNSLKEIKLLQEEMRLIERHHIQNKGDILSVLSGIQDDFRELEEQRQQVKKEWTVYQPVVKQWIVLQRLMPDTKQYKEVLHGLEKYPYSLDEIAQYYQSYKSKLAELRKKKRELQGRQAAWKRILVRLENGIPADAEKRCMEAYDKLYSMYGAPNKIKKVKKEESVKWNRK